MVVMVVNHVNAIITIEYLNMVKMVNFMCILLQF